MIEKAKQLKKQIQHYYTTISGRSST